jgi:hypothetical protein
MKRDNDLGTGLTGCDDGIDERPGENKVLRVSNNVPYYRGRF